MQGRSFHNCVFFYGLPKNKVTSNQIRMKVKELAGVDLTANNQPQIRRDIHKPEWSAIVKLENEEDAKKVYEKMRFFEWYKDSADEKAVEIRALLFDPEIKNRDDPDVLAKNVFLRKLPADMTHSQLFAELSRSLSESDIKSVKVSMDPNSNKSRKYGFASFANQKAAEALIDQASLLKDEAGDPLLLTHSYNPRNRAQMRKVFNNIVIKNFQQDDNRLDDEKYIEERHNYIRNIFNNYGEIISVYVTKINSKKQEAPAKLMAFVCFKDPDTAQKVVDEFNGKEIDGHQLYVAEALKKSELAKEIYKFKNSKKRCNLFVKGFPPEIQEEQLRAFFEQIAGEDKIESLKLEKDKNDPTKAKFAFVCFKSPDVANKVKAQINQDTNLNINGQKLFVNYYELKEVRQMQQAADRDRADYQIATNANNQPLNAEKELQRPELISTLMYLMQHLNQPGRGGINQMQRNPRMQGQRGGMPMNQRGGMGQRPMPHPQQPHMAGHMQPKPAMPPVGMPPVGMPPAGMPQGFPQQQQQQQQPPQMMPGMPPNPIMMQQQQFAAQQNPLAMNFMQTCGPIIPGVTESNTNAKELVGEKIYEFVCQLAGEELGPKITGMLIDLPYDEIRDFLADYSQFERKVMQARTLLTSQQQ